MADVDLTEKYPVDENNRGFQYYQKSIQQKTLNNGDWLRRTEI